MIKCTKECIFISFLLIILKHSTYKNICFMFGCDFLLFSQHINSKISQFIVKCIVIVGHGLSIIYICDDAQQNNPRHDNKIHD